MKVLRYLHSAYPRHNTWCSTLLLVGGLTFAAAANAGGHRAVSNDDEGLESYEIDPSWGSVEEVDGTYGDSSEYTIYGPGAYGGDSAVIGENELFEVDSEELNDLLSLPAMEEGGSSEITPDQGRSEEGDGSEVILGPDARVQLYTRSYPARAITLITFNGGRCSGVLIGHNTVATAGHCLHSGGRHGRWHTNVRVYPGYDGRVAPYGSCRAKRLYSVTGWTRYRSEYYDYGAIKLNCTVGYRVGWFGFRANASYHTPSIITGYPGDKPLQMWQSSDKVRTRSYRQLFYANDTKGGMSGSPIWEDYFYRNRSYGPRVIGIHAYGTHGGGSHRVYNHGTRIVSPVYRNLLNWKNAR